MKTIPEISFEAQQLIQRLDRAAVGELITYAELSEIIGGNVQNGKYHFLQTARRRLLNDSSKVFDCVRGEGVMRVEDVIIVGTSKDQAFRKIRSAAKVGVKRLATVDFDALPNDIKIQHNLTMSVLGAVGQFTKPARLKEIQQRVEIANDRLQIGSTLDMFRTK